MGNGLDFVCVFVGFIFVCVCFHFFVVVYKSISAFFFFFFFFLSSPPDPLPWLAFFSFHSLGDRAGVWKKQTQNQPGGGVGRKGLRRGEVRGAASAPRAPARSLL